MSAAFDCASALGATFGVASAGFAPFAFFADKTKLQTKILQKNPTMDTAVAARKAAETLKHRKWIPLVLLFLAIVCGVAAVIIALNE